MGAKKKVIFHEQIQSSEQFEALISEDEKRMVVIDCHLDWCGPCHCMEPNWPTIWFSLDDPAKRISFWQIKESLLPAIWQEKLALTIRPRFLIFFGGQLKEEIEGAKLNDIEKGVNDHLPSIE